MKKIGILTFHRALNYGAVLQAYALSRILSETDGLRAEVIDYRCPKIEDYRSLKRRMAKPSVNAVLGSGLMLYKKRIFDKFLQENLSLSSMVYSPDTISKSADCYDGFVVGSDQVWNGALTGEDSAYLLPFVPPDTPKFSYAASSGKLSVLKNSTEALSAFRAVSVRESAAETILRESVPTVQTHLDPVLLLPREAWSAFAPHTREKRDYILVYNVPIPTHLFAMAKGVSAELQLEPVYVTNSVRPPHALKKLRYPGIREFVGLFRDARYVVTNSFHGTAFAILFHVPMLVELQGNDSDERLLNLLKICGLTDRIACDGSICRMSAPIDWERVDRNLFAERSRCLIYLRTIADAVMKEMI